ncbi:uncharacterized protein LOC135926731 [Gordionus sp. m RMFG-2023]|uniref:uncharacterized protein LOC135926731 n=1 Tax=Gordionus sp. m RMFG-2023 TaxID=3053472 RepID=UPI0031FD9930
MDNLISRKLEKLLEDKELLDVKLILNNESYDVHKLILSANSPVFKAMLSNTNWSSCNQESIILTEDPICVTYFPMLIKYMYTSYIKFNFSNVLPILILADKYEIHDLIKLCINFINNNVGYALKQGEIISWYLYCTASDQSNKNLIEEYIIWNFSYILDSDYFMGIPLQILIKFLKKSELIVINELQIKICLEKWIQHNKECLNTPELEILYKYIRTPYLPLNTLAEIFTTNDNLSYNLNIATKFHAFTNKERNIMKINKKELILTSPRIYISELWSTTFVIPNFSNFPNYGIRTEIFSTLSSASRADHRLYWEWILDFYPKGINYDKSLYISMNKTFEVPGLTLNSVQAKLTAINPIESHRSSPNSSPTSNFVDRLSTSSSSSYKDAYLNNKSPSNCLSTHNKIARKVDVYFLFHASSNPSYNKFKLKSPPLKSPASDSASKSSFIWPDHHRSYLPQIIHKPENVVTVNEDPAFLSDNEDASYLEHPNKLDIFPTPTESHEYVAMAVKRTGCRFFDESTRKQNFYDYQSTCGDDYKRKHLNGSESYSRTCSIKFEDLIPSHRLETSSNRCFNGGVGSLLRNSVNLSTGDPLFLEECDALKVTVVIVPS